MVSSKLQSPAVVATAQPAILVPTLEKRGAEVRSMLSDEAYASFGVAEGYELGWRDDVVILGSLGHLRLQ